MIYAMSDLHLPSILKKDMEQFGWGDHLQKIKKNWNLSDEDTIIIPGDLSWGLKIDEITSDMEFLKELPGRKIISKGNHDMWWNSKKKVKNFMKQYGIDIIHNDSIVVDDIAICAIRGWDVRSTEDDDLKIINREGGRLKLTLSSAGDKEKIVFFHYPPIYKDKTDTIFLDILKEFGIKEVYYGHIHGEHLDEVIEGDFDGIKFKCVASDQLQFKPLRIR